MTFKYVPVLRSREAEINVLLNQKFSNKVLPLLEIICDKPRKNGKISITNHKNNLFSNLNFPLLIDIPMNIKFVKKIDENIKNFLTPIYDNPISRIDYYNKLNSYNIIPVVSYNPNKVFVKDSIAYQCLELRNHFKTIAFRIYESFFYEAMQEIEQILFKNDILILDIDENHHNDTNKLNLYSKIKNIKSKTMCKTVLVHSAISSSISNTQIQDNIPMQIDNTLITEYTNYHFDAFGDYAGIKRAVPLNIPVVSPAYIHYHSLTNEHIGFKGKYKDIKSFETDVLPKYSHSSYWNSLNSTHKLGCYGCTLLDKMLKKQIKVNYAPKWKTITISHYIRSIDEKL